MSLRLQIGLMGMALLAACSPPEQAPPLTPEVMIPLMVDLRTLEGAYASVLTKPDTMRAHMAAQYQMIFDRRGVTHEQYITAYRYFMARPEQMEAIEDSVINRISDQINRQSAP